MSASRDLRRQQRKWAASAGLAVDKNGYLAEVDQNFREPLTTEVLEEFRAVGGGELDDQRRLPAKLRALHSSAALAINIFQYWRNTSAQSLLSALGVVDSLQKLTFEAQFPTALSGTPRSLDVALKLASGHVIAIESKFTEWMSVYRPKLDAFNEKYTSPGQTLWTDAGLKECQRLANEIAIGEQKFRHLDALQLLKHGLGLATQLPGQFTLHYLYFDWPCEASKKHAAEIEMFDRRVGEELRFMPLTYQHLYERLRDGHAVDADYMSYLGGRYFPDKQTQ
jgi:hypothetical protein